MFMLHPSWLGIAAMVASPLAVMAPHKASSNETWGDRSLVAPPTLNGVVVIDRPIRQVTIRNLRVDGAYRVIENGAKGATAEKILMDGVHATNIVRGLGRFGSESSGVIQNSSVSFTATPQVPPNLPEGLHFQDAAHDWLIRNVQIEGAQMIMEPKRYWNGDGIATERGTHGFRIINVTSINNTDAGFDLKSSDTYLDQVSASGNARNYRLWTSMRIGTLTTGDTIRRGGIGVTTGLWIKGDQAVPPVIRIDHLIVRMTRPGGSIMLVADGPASIEIGSCDIQAPKGTIFLSAPRSGPAVTTSFGPGCVVP